MKIARKISDRGQVVVPEEIRKQAGIKGGEVLLFDFKNGQITVEKQKSDVERFYELIQSIPDNQRKRFDIDKTLEEAYAEREKAWRRKK